MTEPAEPFPPAAQPRQPDDAGPRPERDPTRRMTLPPVPRRRRRPAGNADQPTDELPEPAPREPTDTFGPWQPLQPRVVPRHRSRTPWVIASLVVLVLAVGVLAYLIYGR